MGISRGFQGILWVFDWIVWVFYGISRVSVIGTVELLRTSDRPIDMAKLSHKLLAP